MEKAFIVSEEVKFELADESDETEDPLTNENTIDTSANANMGTPTIRQVCSWITDGTAENMSVEEIEIEEIKLESTDEFDPSLHLSSKQPVQLVTEKADESGQLVASMSRTSSANEHQYRRLRCNYCSLLFYNEKTLTNHQKKCQQVSEKMNAAMAVPVAETNDILKNLQKRLPQFTVAITGNEDAGTSNSADVGTTGPRSSHRKPASGPINITVSIVPKAETPTPPIAPIPIDTDPLNFNTASVQPSSNSFQNATPIPPSISTLVNTTPVSSTSGMDYQYQGRNTSVPTDIAIQLERIVNEVALLRKENCLLRESLAVSREEHGDYNVFDFEPLDTHEQLEEFEEKLGKDAAFASNMVTRLRQTVAGHPKNRIVQSLDYFITRQLFAKCSWTGVGKLAPKIQFCKLKNIHTLLQRVSGASLITVENVLRLRLRHATKRLLGIPTRKSFAWKKSISKGKKTEASGEDTNN